MQKIQTMHCYAAKRKTVILMVVLG